MYRPIQAFCTLFILAATVVAAAPDSRAEFFLGETIVRADATGTIMVAVDLTTAEGDADGRVDQYFLFNTEEIGPRNWQRWIPSAQITFSGRTLVIRDLESGYLGRFSMDPCQVEATTLRRPFDEVTTLCGGFELVRSRVEGVAPEDSLKARTDVPVMLTHLLQDPSLWPAFLTADPDAIFDEEPCIAGGVGSSTCKVTCYQYRDCEVTPISANLPGG
jgi:hypothetical protein